MSAPEKNAKCTCKGKSYPWHDNDCERGRELAASYGSALVPDPVHVMDALDGWGTATDRAMILAAECRYLKTELEKETARINWLLPRQYDHQTRESVDEEIEAENHDAQMERQNIIEGNGP